MENRKVYLDKHTNLLQLEEHMYPLVDVDTPNVFRNLFHYDEIPKIAFNDRIVPHSMPDGIWITDTTFRDGQQSRAPYSTDQIVTIFDYMHRLGGSQGKIRQSEFFLYSKKDRDAVYKCMERGYRFPEITSWIRANKKDFELVKDLGMKETGILVSCSDYHIFYKLKMTRREAMEHYLSVVRECLETGVSPRCHLEDITRSDIYGFVIPFCLELMHLMEEYQIPVKIRVCDTMGYGVNYPGAVIPRSIPGIIYGLRVHAGLPSELIEFKGHNDFYKGVVNASTAWLYGAGAVNCSLLGIGERTGNVDIVTLGMNMYSQGVDPKLDFSDMPHICEIYEECTGMKVGERSPYSGALVFAAFSGSHQDAIAKGMHWRDDKDPDHWNVPYLPIDPTDVGRNYDADVIRINSQSGKGGVGYILETKFGLNLPPKMREAMGYATKAVSDHKHKELHPDEIFNLFKQTFENITEPYSINEVHFQQKDGGIVTKVTSTFRGKTITTEASGNGRLDAVSNALKKAYELKYSLETYQEHALERSSSSKAIAYVGIKKPDGTLAWGAGVDADIIRASIDALVTAINNR